MLADLISDHGSIVLRVSNGKQRVLKTAQFKKLKMFNPVFFFIQAAEHAI